MNRLLTAKEAGHILRLNVFTVYDMARDGRLPTVRLGRGIRFRPEDLEAWLAAGGSCSQQQSQKPGAPSTLKRAKRGTCWP